MCHVVADQSTDIVGFGEGDDKDHADQGRYKTTETAENTVSGNMAHVAIQQKGDDFDGTTRDTENETFLIGVSKTCDL